MRLKPQIAKRNPPFGPWYSVNLSGYRLVYRKGLFQGKARDDESAAAFYVADDKNIMRKAAFLSNEEEMELWVDDGNDPPEWVIKVWKELWGSYNPKKRWVE